jgi:hypothetical protein
MRIVAIACSVVALSTLAGCGNGSDVTSETPVVSAGSSAGGFPATPMASPQPTPPGSTNDPAPMPSPTSSSPPVPSASPSPVAGGNPSGAIPLVSQFAALDKQAPDFNVSSSVIAAGLDVWMKPDKFGMACANCHGSPGAIEFAFVGFSKDNIHRRGSFHFPVADIDKVRAMVDELARLYKLPKNDPATFRALQPGGVPTAGATYQERDYNFLLSLKNKYAPTLLNTKMESLAQAEAAYKEIAAIKKDEMPIPTLSPLWSGDGFHGRDRDSHHEWIARLPSLPLSEEGKQKIRNAMLAYLAKPSNENFFTYYSVYKNNSSVGTIATGSTKNDADAVSRNAYFVEQAKPLIAMYAAHDVMQKALGVPSRLASRGLYATLVTSGPEAGGRDLQFVDAFSRMSDSTQQKSGGAYDIPAVALGGVAADIQANLSAHMKFGTPDWWGLSFTFEPAVNTIGANYWRDAMVENGSVGFNQGKGFPPYVSFMNFSMTSMGVLRNLFREKTALGGDVKPRYFSIGHNPTLLALADEPQYFHNAEHQALNKRMVLNVAKMQMLLLISDRQKALGRGEVVYDWIGGNQLSHTWDFIELMKSFARNSAMASEVAGIDKLGRDLAKVSRAVAHRDRGAAIETSGTGLKVQYFDDANFTQPIGSAVTVPGISVNNMAYSEIDYFKYSPSPKMVIGPTSVPAFPQGSIKGSSAIWSGQIAANHADTYTFRIPLQDKNAPLHDVRITIDGVVVLAEGKFGSVGKPVTTFEEGSSMDQYGGFLSLPIEFTAGQRRSIKVEHSTTEDSGQFLSLVWFGKKEPVWLVQPENLFPN